MAIDPITATAPEYDAPAAAERVAIKRRAKIKILPPPEVPVTPTWFGNSDVLAQAIRMVRFGVAKDDARPTLTGIHLADGYATAANGFLAMQYPCDLGPITGILASRDLDLFSRFNDADIALRQDTPDSLTVENNAAVLYGSTMQRLSLVNGTFPNVKHLLRTTSSLGVDVSAALLRWIATGQRTFEDLAPVPVNSWAKRGRKEYRTVAGENILKLKIAMGGWMTLHCVETGEPVTIKIDVAEPPLPEFPEIPKKTGKRELGRIMTERAELTAMRRAEFYAQPPFEIAVNAPFLAGMLAPLPRGTIVHLGFHDPGYAIMLTVPHGLWRGVLMPMHVKK